jgi:hypothetical protein
MQASLACPFSLSYLGEPSELKSISTRSVPRHLLRMRAADDQPDAGLPRPLALALLIE